MRIADTLPATSNIVVCAPNPDYLASFIYLILKSTRRDVSYRRKDRAMIELKVLSMCMFYIQGGF